MPKARSFNGLSVVASTYVIHLVTMRSQVAQRLFHTDVSRVRCVVLERLNRFEFRVQDDVARIVDLAEVDTDFEELEAWDLMSYRLELALHFVDVVGAFLFAVTA